MKKLYFFVLILACASAVRAQDPHFSQYFSNPIYLNPSFAGYNGCPTISTSYRNQFPSSSSNFQTANASFDMLVGKRYGLALNYQYDHRANVIIGQSLNLIYAPTFRVFKKQLAISPSLGMAWRYRKINTSSLTYENIADPRYNIDYEIYDQGTPLPTEDRIRNFADFSMGLLLCFKGLVYGASFDHLTQPDEGFYGGRKLPIRFSSHISYQFKVTDKFKLAPALIFINQQDYTEFLPSATFSVFGAKAGFAYRVNIHNPDHAILMFGYEAKGFKFGYSYDLTVTPNPTAAGGSHEVSLAYVVNCKKSEFRKGVPIINF